MSNYTNWYQARTLKGLLIKILVLLLVVVTVIASSLRFSEQHGTMATKGCVIAIFLSFIAAILGLFPFLMSRKKKVSKLFLSLIVGAGIRITVVALGVVVITVIVAKEQRFWFLAWTAVFYLLFLGIETTEAVCCIKKLEFENDIDSDNDGHDACKYESS